MLHLHRSERADALAAALGALLAVPLEDPFRAEVVAVPTRGIERWLSQRLAAVLGSAPGRGDGVCANIEFPFPERVLAAALDAARMPPDTGGEASVDAWSPERAVWPLVEVVAACSGEAWMSLLAGHLARGGGAQRFAALRHVADLFDRYGVHRPAMIRDWAGGRDVDASGKALEDDLAWQAELWRRLRRAIGRPSPAERLVEACAGLRSGEVDVDLPLRLSLFGLTRLPPSYLEVLRAVAARREVHLFLLHPSPALWSEIEEHGEASVSPIRRTDDASTGRAHHPLLASWGRDAREMQLVLHAGSDAGSAFGGTHHEAPRPTGRSLLACIQSDIRENRRPPGAPAPGEIDERMALAPSDRSIQVHDCHGRGRQVEVVRDAVLHLLADDPTLEPRDVIVMCPDIESWAPLIRAAFDVGGPPERGAAPPSWPQARSDDALGPSAGGSGADSEPADETAPVDLRARLADRSLRQTNPLFGLISVLLGLAGSRVTASQVLDLAAAAPVRRRFCFDDAELARLRQWVGASGIRWGIDAAHRASFGLEHLGENSWRAGLDRLLLGVAVSEEHGQLVGGVLALEDVASSEVELAGRFAELVERLATTLDELSPPGRAAPARPVTAWGEAIRSALDRLALSSEPERWQRLQVDRLLDDIAGEACGEGPPILLAELRALLADRLRGRPTRANFRTGHLTICTLVPMRSVPHRVVCLLGMDDGAFPRHATDDGDDIVGRDPWVGDRDARGEDRQLLLDALLAAGEHLVVTYRGRDERTNAPRPPCVPVGELLDVIDATARAEPATWRDEPAPSSASEQVVVRHPLQPFDERCFTAGALAGTGPWSFDAVNLAGARAAAAQRRGRQAFLEGPLPSLEEDVIELADLARFVRRPVADFLRRRLGLRFEERHDESMDSIPIELDPLERHGVGERILTARMSGLSMSVCLAAEKARGALPPGTLADRLLDSTAELVETLLRACGQAVDLDAARRTIDVRLPLGGGTTLVGSVAGVYGEVLCALSYSRISAARRLETWVRLLALAASHHRFRRAVTVGRSAAGADTRGEGVTVAVLTAPPDPGAALEELVELYRRGMREPLPLYARTSEAWAAARHRGRGEEAVAGASPSARGRGGQDRGNAAPDPARRAGNAWRPARRWDGGIPPEGDEEAHVLVLGSVAFGELLAELPRPDESGPGWAADEASRFGRYARRLWDPLLGCEHLEER